MSTLLACGAGVILDQIFGDPRFLYHPVRIIGKWIEIWERVLRRAAGENPRRLLAAGWILWFLVIVFSVGIPWGLLAAAGKIHPYLRFALETFWCYQLLAARSLKTESRKVYERLEDQDLTGARKAVSMIVGRDTEALDMEGVTRAAVETVAENTSDGVTAPLLYMIFGGAPLGFFYKAVNTMDSMVGYKNEKYLYFGRAAARMDDLMNYIPARISALFMIAGAWICRLDAKGAWRIFRRDRRNHASPNSAQTEAVCAGALGVQLAGDAYYFGKLYPKKTIGDPVRRIEPEDIIRAGWLMDTAEILVLVVFGSVKYMIIYGLM